MCVRERFRAVALSQGAFVWLQKSVELKAVNTSLHTHMLMPLTLRE